MNARGPAAEVARMATHAPHDDEMALGAFASSVDVVTYGLDRAIALEMERQR